MLSLSEMNIIHYILQVCSIMTMGHEKCVTIKPSDFEGGKLSQANRNTIISYHLLFFILFLISILS